MTQEEQAEMLEAAYRRADKYDTTTGVVLSAVAIAAGFVLFGDALPRLADASWMLAAAAAVGVSAAALFCLLGLSAGPMHAHFHEPAPADGPGVSIISRRKRRQDLQMRLAQHVILVNGLKAAVLRGAAYSALMALIAAYCAVLLSLPPQDDASNHAADIAGWIFLGAAMAILAWFTYRYSALAHKCRDRVLSEAEKTRHLIALAKYKRTLVDKQARCRAACVAGGDGVHLVVPDDADDAK